MKAEEYLSELERALSVSNNPSEYGVKSSAKTQILVAQTIGLKKAIQITKEQIENEDADMNDILSRLEKSLDIANHPREYGIASPAEQNVIACQSIGLKEAIRLIKKERCIERTTELEI